MVVALSHPPVGVDPRESASLSQEQRKGRLTWACEDSPSARAMPPILPRCAGEPPVWRAVSRPVRGLVHRRPMTTPRSCFATRLDAEWTHLRTARRALQRARSWSSGDPADPIERVLERLTTLDDLIAATQRGAGGTDDAILARLVDVARTDELAGRVVIQRLLPGLISRSARYRGFGDPVHPIEVVVPAAWLAVRSYDTVGRPRNIAAALISDAVFSAFRQPLRRRASTEVRMSPHRFCSTIDEPGPVEPIIELAGALREAAAAGVERSELDLLRHIARSDSPTTVASQRGVTERTIRNHRARAVAHVRNAIAA